MVASYAATASTTAGGANRGSATIDAPADWGPGFLPKCPRIIVERHLLHTGSARARELLDNWDAALGNFVKVMPTDYARALADIKAASQATVAAE